MTVENEQPDNPETENSAVEPDQAQHSAEQQYTENQASEKRATEAQTTEQQPVDGPTADEQPAPTEDQTVAEPVAEVQVAETQATEEKAAEDAQDEEPGRDAPKRDPRIPEVITTRTLFFLAPDLPPPSERQPARRRRDDDGNRGRDDRDQRDDHDDQDDHDDDSGRRPTGRGRSRSRRGNRSQDRRDNQRHSRDSNRQHDDRDSDSRDDDGREEVREQITEPQKIQGSTRLAAKRARRREGRETGRRRVVVTESEFQARRESVDRKMLVRSKNNRVQIGVLEDNILVEHYVARNEDVSLIGNVYVGRVQNVLPSMEAAFIDIGGARNAVLYSGEVDWSAAELGANQPRKIENALKSGDKVLVQVTKDPVGHKGARLTSQVSLPGRYLVYVPGNTMNGISRKLPDTERNRLKKILKEVLPEGVGVIVRTAAEGATQEQLQRDVERLTKQWDDIQRKAKNSAKAPQTLHSESDMLIKIVRDVFNEDFDQLIVHGQSELDTIKSYLGQIAPDLVDRVERFQGDDIFSEYRVNDMIDKALARKVWLPSGGSLVIDRTEAMTVIDVNTGKFVGTGGNLEETVTKNNLEAAEEIVRQLRLRDIGGIIVIDFIDMVLESNRDLVQRRLVEGLSRDRTKHQVAEVTSLGLVQMTRKKIGLGLLETFSESCTHCDGRGVVISGEPVSHTHSSNQSQNGGRKNGRGSRSRGKGSQGHQQQDSKQHSESEQHHNGSSTHEITEDARNALTKIAASTIASSSDSNSADAEKRVEKAVEAATKEIVKVVKQIEVSSSSDSTDASGHGSQSSRRSGRGSNRRGSENRDSQRRGGGRDRSTDDSNIATDASANDSGQQDQVVQGSASQSSKSRPAQDSGTQSGHAAAAKSSGAEQRDSGAASSHENGAQDSSSSRGTSRRSRRNRRVRTEAPQTPGLSPESQDAPKGEDAGESQVDKNDNLITIELPEPVAQEPQAPQDPKQVEQALNTLDAALDSLAGLDASQDNESEVEPTADPVQTAEPAENKKPATASTSPSTETTADSTQSGSGTGRKRGGRRRITTGPITTGSEDES
ncbi:MAG: Rne/Rng family ribonuclease [Gulosibacter sp.]|uniref:Rne/Rng family ribonuclease n=1 Tax=Gulosibacter sp. TaxID=2817531 RepID=UPI003F90714A